MSAIAVTPLNQKEQGIVHMSINTADIAPGSLKYKARTPEVLAARRYES